MLLLCQRKNLYFPTGILVISLIFSNEDSIIANNTETCYDVIEFIMKMY